MWYIQKIIKNPKNILKLKFDISVNLEDLKNRENIFEISQIEEYGQFVFTMMYVYKTVIFDNRLKLKKNNNNDVL